MGFQVFSEFNNITDLLRESGREFHAFGAATANARSPNLSLMRQMS